MELASRHVGCSDGGQVHRAGVRARPTSPALHGQPGLADGSLHGAPREALLVSEEVRERSPDIARATDDYLPIRRDAPQGHSHDLHFGICWATVRDDESYRTMHSTNKPSRSRRVTSIPGSSPTTSAPSVQAEIRQQKPLPHILMCYRPREMTLRKLASKPGALGRIRRALEWDGRPRVREEEVNAWEQEVPEKVDAALQEVSIAYAKYRTGAAQILREQQLSARRKKQKEARQAGDEASEVVPRDKLSSKLLSRATERAELTRLLKMAEEAHSVLGRIHDLPLQRVLFLLGEDPKNRRWSRMPLDERRARAKEDGWKKFVQLDLLLQEMSYAASEALNILPREGGRPPGPAKRKVAKTDTKIDPADRPREPIDFFPQLAKSLIHELADIWCRFHGKPYSASKNKLFGPVRNAIRSHQRAAWFVETVIEEGRVELGGADFLRISATVRNEREKMWKVMYSADETKMRRQLELLAAPLDFVSRRR